MPKPLTRAAIAASLTTHTLGRAGVCLETIDSTNEEAKRLARAGAADGTLVTAEYQTGGKGRLGRSWVSPPGSGLTCTVLLCGSHLPQTPAGVTLLAGMAVCSTLREDCDVDARIKWPNDVIIGSKKVCGILAEAGLRAEGPWAIVGVGINITDDAFPPELAQRATSLLLATGCIQDRCAILCGFLARFEALLEAEGGLPRDYKPLCVTLGRHVRFTRNGQHQTGLAVDVSPDGSLLVALPDGKRVSISSGEVTVQGIYGE